MKRALSFQVCGRNGRSLNSEWETEAVSHKGIDVKSDVQSAYVANMKKTVWQTGGCSAFYRKNMTDEVTSLSPESVVNFIFTRKWFHLSDHNLLR